MHLNKYLAIATIALISTVANVCADITTTGQIVGTPVTSTSSNSLIIGNTASGTMTINGFGTDHDVYSGASYISDKDGSAGSAVAVKDSGSQWGTSTLMVGYSDSATLDITNGGVVTSLGSTVGYFGPRSTVTVDGAGSSWTCSDFS